jgi:hypothetical protein
MWLLFKAELRRFRIPGAIACIAHLVVLGFMSRTSDLAQQSALAYKVMGACYALAGVILGAFQMAGYARPAAWMQLIHRPLSSWRIGLALLAAGVAWIALAIALPIVLIAAWQATLTSRVIDLRHWLMAVPALTISAIGYALGAYAVLANRRIGFGAVVFLQLLLVARAQAWDALLLQWLIVAYFGALLWIVFRADRNSLPSSPWRLGLMFAPMVFTLSLLLLGALRIGFQSAWIMLGSAPAFSTTPPANSVQESHRATDKALMLQGLRASHDPMAASWADDVSKQEKIERYGAMFEELPVRQQFTNVLPLSQPDATNDTLWTFSHDRMRFVGRGLADDRSDRSTLAPPEAQAFATPAMPVAGALGIADAGSVVLLGAQRAWRYDPHSRNINLLLALPAHEVFASPPMRMGAHLVALSDQAIYVSHAATPSPGMLSRIPLPGPINVLARVSVADVRDGSLVSLTYTRNFRYESFARAQYVVHVDAKGQSRIVSWRPLTQDFPIWFSTMDWWMSPLLDRSEDALRALFAAQPGLDPQDPHLPPAGIVWLALACALCCAALTALLARRWSFSKAATATWMIVNALLGPAGLIGLWLIGDRGLAYRRANVAAPLRVRLGDGRIEAA